jgi:CHAT domain
MISLLEPKFSGSVLSESQQRNDLEKTDLFLHITQQLWIAQLALEMGQVNEATITDLQDVLLVSRMLLQMGAPQLPLYLLEDVQLCRAETFKTIAQSYAALEESEKAFTYGQKAARIASTLEQPGRAMQDQGMSQESGDFLCWETVPTAYRLFQKLIRAAIQTAYRLQKWDFMMRWIELTKRGAIEPPQGITVHELERALQQMSDTLQQGNVTSELFRTSLRAQGQLLWSEFIHQKLLRRRQSQPFDLSAVQAQLAADEGILYYYCLSPDQLLIVILDHQQIFARIQPVSAADQRLLHRVNPGARQGQRAITPDQLEQLSQLLLPIHSRDTVIEQQRSLLQQKQRLLISGQNNLQHIPFQILPWDGGCLIQRFALTHIPDLSSLLSCHGQDGKNPMNPMLVVEDQGQLMPPATTDSHQDWLKTHGHVVTQLTATEGTATIGTLDLLADIGALQHYRYLHFTAQGQSGQHPLDAHLQLQDTHLHSLKIANWQLNADLVILDMTPDPELVQGYSTGTSIGSGLRSAFFAAGAKRVISAHHSSAEISNAILTGFHGYLAQGNCVEVALQKALQDSLEEGKQRGEGEDAYTWAPFSLAAFGRPA